MNSNQTIPQLTLRLGPSGSGKADWALARWGEMRGRALLVVASVQQAETRAELAIERFGMSAPEVRSLILPFHGLVNLLLTGETHGVDYVGRAFQRLALLEIFRANIREEDFLGRMLSAPGFVPAFQERLREWKLAGLTPDDLQTAANAAVDRGRVGLERKLTELTRLFRAYESFLADNRLSDEEDGLPRAAQRVHTGTAPIPDEIELILFDGFYRFNRVQRDLLAALASRTMRSERGQTEVAVTLPYEERRPLLFAAPARTLRALRSEFHTVEMTGVYQPDSRPPVLSLLGTRLFDLQPASPERAARTVPPYSQSAGSVQIIDAPNPYVEAELVAREFCRLREALHAQWCDFAVILRTVGDYAPILSAVFERYGIPLGIDGPEALAENPLLKTLLHLLDIVRWDWRREDVLAFLKSSYTRPSKLTVDRFRQRAQSRGVRGGRSEWLPLIEQEQGALGDTLRLIRDFDELFSAAPAETFRFIEIMLQAVADFGLEERISTGEPNRVERDKTALREGKDLLEALARMAAIRDQPILTFANFHAAVLEAWKNGTAMSSRHGDQVRVTDPYDVRERPVRIVAVMGLTERVFPRRITEDPFLRDEEREFLQEVAGVELEALRGRSDDERFLFYLAVTAPTDRLLLSFPRASQENDTLPSFYIDEVKAACGDVDHEPVLSELTLAPAEADAAPDIDTTRGYTIIARTLADVAPRPDELVNSSDRLLAACADLFDPGSQEDPSAYRGKQQAALALMERCLQDGEVAGWARTALASRRLPRLPILVSPDLRAAFNARLPVYTPAELETFARCPFQFLLRYVWKLRPESDGLDRGRQSALLHSILRRFFRKRARQGKTQLSPEEAQEVQLELRDMLHTDLAKNAFDTGPHHRRIVQRRLGEDLDRFVLREAKFAGQFEMTPAHFHLTFGMETKEIAPDGYSSSEPLWLEGADGAPGIGICGAIDRVDVDASGRRALVLDYEAGKPPEFSAVQRGESLQMPLYLMAVEQLFGMAGAAACYDSMRESGRRRFHRAEHVNIRQFGPVEKFDDPANVKPLNRDQFAELTKTAQTTAIRLAHSIAEADIRPTPGDHCATCSYRDICRTTMAEGHDGELVI